MKFPAIIQKIYFSLSPFSSSNVTGRKLPLEHRRISDGTKGSLTPYVLLRTTRPKTLPPFLPYLSVYCDPRPQPSDPPKKGIFMNVVDPSHSGSALHAEALNPRSCEGAFHILLSLQRNCLQLYPTFPNTFKIRPQLKQPIYLITKVGYTIPCDKIQMLNIWHHAENSRQRFSSEK